MLVLVGGLWLRLYYHDRQGNTLGYNEACAVTLDGELVCWGEPPGGLERPDRVRARSVKIAHGNGCALLEDKDELVCWGFDDPERYKDGTPDGEAVYVPSP